VVVVVVAAAERRIGEKGVWVHGGGQRGLLLLAIRSEDRELYTSGTLDGPHRISSSDSCL